MGQSCGSIQPAILLIGELSIVVIFDDASGFFVLGQQFVLP
jgi:hypothetical protein